jgi:TonB family protein
MMLDTVGTWIQSAYMLSALPLGLARALMIVLARRSASLRHHVWMVALTIAIAAPVARAVVPRLNVPLLRPENGAAPRRLTPAATADEARPETAGGEHGQSPSRWSARTIAALLWIAGAVPLLCVRALRHTRLLRLVVEASAVDDRTDVRTHSRVMVPMLVGFRRPTILLPTSAASWPVDAREAVLAHERAHVQRRDHVTTLVSDVATIVYWLNPLVWMAAARLEREREAACDEEVLRAGIKPSIYAAALLMVAETLPVRRPAAAVPSIAGGRLDARIRAVLHGSPHSGHVPLSWPATIALIAVCAGLAGSVRLVARTPRQTVFTERPTPAREMALNDPVGMPTSLERRPASTPARQTGTDGASRLESAGLEPTDFGDFCCPDYLRTMIDTIRRNWVRQREDPEFFCRPSQDACRGTLRFTIKRDGTISKVMVEKPSGYRILDTQGLRAVRLIGKLPPLPAAFPKPTLTVHFGFAASSEFATPLELPR